MEQAPPVWLNKIFLKKVLLEGRDSEDVKINSFKVKPAVLGKYYLTFDVYRVQVEYEVEEEIETVSLIIKVPPVRRCQHENFEKFGFFYNEIAIYNNLLSVMSEKVSFEFGPTLFYSPIQSFLVLEDLRESGYEMCDESQQLDFGHCLKVVETLAKFHASSVACYNENPLFLEEIGDGILWAENCVFKPYVTDALKTVLRIVNVMDGCEEFFSLLFDRIDHLWDSVVNISKPKSTGLNVLNHGDLWANNVLFKYDASGNVEDVKFIDFQITKFGTPALDLINFIWTSANEEVRDRRQPELYHAYVCTLNCTLKQLGCEERYGKEELKKDLEMATDWGILMICCALPVIMSPPESIPDPADFTFTDFRTNKFEEIYRGKKFRHILPSVTKHFTEFFKTLT